jgi:hypothetical protein
MSTKHTVDATPEERLTLAASRDDLRRALGRERSNGSARNRPPIANVSSEFPRSKLMRALLNEDLRWVWIAGATALTVVAGRRLGTAQQLGRWIGAYSLVRRLLDRTSARR